MEDEISVEQIKRETLNRRIRAARSLAERMQVAPDGSRVFVRFSRGERIEHVVLMVSFATLAVTGLCQTFSELPPIAFAIEVMGGVDAIRTIHRMAAIASAIQSFYHIWRILEMWFVKRQRGGMWPHLSDLQNLVQMLKFNAGLTNTWPQFDRFTIEEKLEILEDEIESLRGPISRNIDQADELMERGTLNGTQLEGIEQYLASLLIFLPRFNSIAINFKRLMNLKETKGNDLLKEIDALKEDINTAHKLYQLQWGPLVDE